MNRLDNKTILVTGAASGIGCATAIGCAEAGAQVIAVDLADGERIASATGLGDHHFCTSLNIIDEAAAAAVVHAARERYGKIDGLVNCAGIGGRGAAHQLDIGEWKKVLDVNLTGSVILAKHVIAAMIEKKTGGSVVNLASAYGMTGGPASVPYNTSKGAILQLTRSMAVDYGPAGIRVNSVSPGYIETPMSEMLKHAPAFRQSFIDMHLLKRPGQSGEVAAAIVFLLSDDASYITGVNLPVDGGFTSAHVPPAVLG